METKRWYQILAHGVGPPNNSGSQKYESEIFNIQGDYLIFDSIDKMRTFIDTINIFLINEKKVLGRTLPFVLLEIQSIPTKIIIDPEPITEEWYVYDIGQNIYVNVGFMNINEAIDTYNSFNQELL